ICMKKSFSAVIISIIILAALSACSSEEKRSSPSEQTYYPQYSVNEYVFIKDEGGEVLLNAGHIDNVQVLVTDNQPSVLINFTEEGKALFAAATAEHIGETLEICVGDTVVSSPTVVAEITEGYATVSTDSIEEAEEILEKLKE
ncbi:MAG: SecDF P1 head subdomain-containing protein, partial [Acutalibacteraceae bacterium]